MMAGVIVYVKTNPKKMTFASSGNGSTDHLTAELFWLQTGNFGRQKAECGWLLMRKYGHSLLA